MIYSVDKSLFPSDTQSLELHSYLDENGFEWKISRVDNGFFLIYLGHDYFKESTFDIEIEDESFFIKNTGCFFIQDESFDTFYHFIKLLIDGFTDEIWDSIEEFITDRIKYGGGITEYEIL